MHHFVEKAKVVRLQVPEGRRVIAISDIHGNLTFLKALLEQVTLTKDDILVLVGDLLEKGPSSLETLRYVMELSKTYTIYPVCGNCDRLGLDLVEFGKGEAEADEYFDYCYHLWGQRLLLAQMAKEVGIPCRGAQDLPALREMLVTHFQEEVAFLRSFPHIVETDTHIFVHGGIPQETDLEELGAWSCMKNDNFMGQGYSFKKWVVVGHWPITLYNEYVPIARPLIDENRHIISIDGGCVLKLDGQLNALMIKDGVHSHAAYDGLPVGVALEAQEESPQSVNIRWGDNLVEVIERGVEFCRCRHLSTGRELDILTPYLYPYEEGTKCEDATDYRHPVAVGEKLQVVYLGERCALVKKNGVTGWYYGKLETSASLGTQTKDFRNIP